MAGFVETLRTAGRAAARTFLTFAPQTWRILIGLFLIAAFAATGAVLLFVLTAQQLQNAMDAPDVAAMKVTIGSIRQDVTTVEYYYRQIAANSATLKDADQRVAAAQQAQQGALAQMTAGAADVAAFINRTDTAFIRPPLLLQPFGRPPANATPPALKQAPILDFGSDVAGYFDDYYTALAGLSAAPEAAAARGPLNDFKTQVYKQLDDYARAHAEYDRQTALLQSWNAKIGTVETQNKALWGDLAKGTPLDDNTAYYNLCEDFYSFKLLVGDWAYSIVLLPKMMLVLMLAIFMGILGSLIAISQDYLRNPDGRGFWDILFRIGLGAGVAFALFFFAAAGMLAMSQSSTHSAQADMSPYLISFLGITGGYLSDRVAQWMREVGENTFKIAPAGAPPRWAVGLEAALKAASLDGGALAAASGVTAQEVQGWISLAKPVPGDKQALVAAFLRLHPSHLFTDIAPG